MFSLAYKTAVVPGSASGIEATISRRVGGGVPNASSFVGIVGVAFKEAAENDLPWAQARSRGRPPNRTRLIPGAEIFLPEMVSASVGARDTGNFATIVELPRRRGMMARPLTVGARLLMFANWDKQRFTDIGQSVACNLR